jgi:hypothetical protein
VQFSLGHSAAAASALRHCRAGTSLNAKGPSARHDGQCCACHATSAGARPAVRVTTLGGNARATARAAPWFGKPVRGGRAAAAAAESSAAEVGGSASSAGGRSKNKNKCENPTMRCHRTQDNTTDVPSAVSGT